MLAILKLRWLTFSIRTLFVAVTVCCVWLAYHSKWKRQRSVALKTNAILRAEPFPPHRFFLPFGLRVLGEEAFVITVRDSCTREEISRLRSLFPDGIVDYEPRQENTVLYYVLDEPSESEPD